MSIKVCSPRGTPWGTLYFCSAPHPRLVSATFMQVLLQYRVSPLDEVRVCKEID